MGDVRTKSERFEMRVRTVDRDRWLVAAGHLSLAEWLTMVANAECDAVEAPSVEKARLERKRLQEVSFPGSSTEARPDDPVYTQPKLAKASRRRSEPFCVHRRRKDEFCPRCDA